MDKLSSRVHIFCRGVQEKAGAVQEECVWLCIQYVCPCLCSLLRRLGSTSPEEGFPTTGGLSRFYSTKRILLATFLLHD